MDTATHCLCPPANLLLASISRCAAGLLVGNGPCTLTLDRGRVPLLERKLLTSHHLMSNSCSVRALHPVVIVSKFCWVEV